MRTARIEVNIMESRQRLNADQAEVRWISPTATISQQGAAGKPAAQSGGLAPRHQQLDPAQGTVEHRHGASNWIDPAQSNFEHGQYTSGSLNLAQGAIEEFPAATGCAESHVAEPNNHVSGNEGERAKVKDEGLFPAM